MGWNGAGGWAIFSHDRQLNFADGLDHLPLPGDHLQRLGDVLAELDQLALTARADGGRRDDDALARQMHRQRRPHRPTPADAGGSTSSRRGLATAAASRHRHPRQRSPPAPPVAFPADRADGGGAPTTARSARVSAWRSSASDAPPSPRHWRPAPRPRAEPNVRRETPPSASRDRRARCRQRGHAADRITKSAA